MRDIPLKMAIGAKSFVLGAKEKVEEVEKAFFSKRNTVQFFMMFAIIAVGTMLLMPDAAMAADPLATMKTVYINQAESNAFPVIILWTLVLGVVISFAMGKFMPFILAVIASVIIALTPAIAPNFTASDFNVTTP